MASSASFQVHGMDTHATEADWPAITDNDIQELLRTSYSQLGSHTDILWYSPRPFSSACLVQTTAGTYLIKRYSVLFRNTEDIAAEHAFIQHLAKYAIPVVCPVVSSSATTVVQSDLWLYEVFPQAPGQDLYRDAMSWTPFIHVSHAKAAGTALANLHLASQHYTAPARQTSLLMASDQFSQSATPLTDIFQWISAHSSVASYLKDRSWQQELSAALQAHYTALMPYQSVYTPLWGHNDWHASNLLWKQHHDHAKVSCIIDFGLSNKTSALYDLATAIERNMVAWLSLNSQQPIVDMDALQAFLTAYSTIFTLDQTQYHALAALLPVVHVEYALSELRYFLEVTHSAQHAHLAYQYLIEHAQWFYTQEGQALLSAIAQHQHN